MDPGRRAPSPPSIPFDPAGPRTVAHVWDDVKAGADFVAHNLPRAHNVLVRLNPYPPPWRAVRMRARDGAELAAWYGPGRAEGPAVLMVPGTFQTKDDTTRKRRAIDLWRRLGAHVLIVDLRGFGGSHAHHGSGGLLEARDLHDAADWLRDASGAARVDVWGESLGGAVALVAAALPGADERLRSVIAWSPFAELSDAIQASSIHSRRGRTLVGRIYRWHLRRRSANKLPDFGAYLRHRAAEMEMALADLVVAGSPCYHMEDLKVPATVFHAVDDEIVPVNHARLLARVARDRAPLLSVHIHPRGAHLGFDRVAPVWYRATTSSLLRATEARLG
jgi:alpha-beta hydrolase superfamily lysophospholipase